MRVFETTELMLFAALVGTVDLMMSLHVALSHAYVYISSAPILALYATKAAVAAKMFVVGALLMMFGIVKIHALKKRRLDMPSRVEKAIRTALYTYITSVYAAGAVLIYTLESLSIPPAFSQIP